MPAKPLEGIRVIDCSQIWAGPFATKAMGDMGAQVIKVESARRVDNTRPLWLPSRRRTGENVHTTGARIQLSQPLQDGRNAGPDDGSGKERLQRLVAIGDVVIENFSARVMPGLGLGYHSLREVKDDIIMLSLPAFGATGPTRATWARDRISLQCRVWWEFRGTRAGVPSTSGPTPTLWAA